MMWEENGLRSVSNDGWRKENKTTSCRWGKNREFFVLSYKVLMSTSLFRYSWCQWFWKKNAANCVPSVFGWCTRMIPMFPYSLFYASCGQTSSCSVHNFIRTNWLAQRNVVLFPRKKKGDIQKNSRTCKNNLNWCVSETPWIPTLPRWLLSVWLW